MKYFTRLLACVMMVTSALNMYALNKEYYAESSKLSTGKWVKIFVKESGIYQITAEDIRSWGLGTDLSQIHVFGYGGAPLSETMLGDNYADDLPQMPLVRTDGRILFYAQGPTTWKADKAKLFAQLQVQHPYANVGTYFVTNDSRFNDITINKADNAPTGEVVTTYIERLFHESDIINPGETGRNYLGEDFKGSRKQSFKFALDGLVDGSMVTAYTVFGALAKSVTSTVAYTANSTPLPSVATDQMRKADEHDHYQIASSTKSFQLDGTTSLDFGVEYLCSGTPDLARLDFITINYQRQLALKQGGLCFGLNEASTSKRYRISGAGSTTHVWDVTRAFAPVEMKTDLGDGALTFSPANNGRREFVAFDETATNYPRPERMGNVANQNIHGEPTPDMIILAPSAYLEQARRVADLHEKYDNFRVLVLDHEKVFNEFSSGTRDAMAYRRLCKMFYDRGDSGDGHRLGYLLLMGCGSYDNRQIGTNTAALGYPHLLTWQSPASDNDDSSITTDDYFGILYDGSQIQDSASMDISVGRMIVKSVSEARTVVNKLVKYVTQPYYGAWRNQVMMVADDENNAAHMKQSMTMIANARANGGADMIYNYVFTDAFNAVSEGGARAYPDARKKMFNSLNEGVLWWNYIGHASTQNWTGEGLMMRSDVETQLFYRHLPVLYAATCEYTRFDNSVLSSGERIFLNANGGAIAVICPARLAYITDNGTLSSAVGRLMFNRDEKGKSMRIGDILRLAKNRITSLSDNKRRFFCFGDPAMRLATPQMTARIETINGKPVDPDNLPVFNARQQVEFSGSIVDWKGNPAPNFNGAIVSTLFGPEQEVITHGYGKPEEADTVHYYERTNRLAINVDTVTGGRFTVRVVIPSEVNNEYDNYTPAAINLYAYDSRDSLEAKGVNEDFYIYGYAEEAVTDTIGPEIITLGLNDANFVDASDINESPLVLAMVSDDSGVNFSSAGIGHSMTLTLDGTTSYNDLVSYYTPLFAEKGTLGSISYQLSDLSSGMHTLRLRVWDVYRNVSEKTISFNVVNGLAPEIADVYCTSNPASVETSFYVKHNRPDAIVTVSIEVYDLMGRMVWSTTQSGRSDMYTSTPVTWDLIDQSGRRVPRGIYVYRATISTDGIKEATKAKKLAVTH